MITHAYATLCFCLDYEFLTWWGFPRHSLLWLSWVQCLLQHREEKEAQCPHPCNVLNSRTGERTCGPCCSGSFSSEGSGLPGFSLPIPCMGGSISLHVTFSLAHLFTCAGSSMAGQPDASNHQTKLAAVSTLTDEQVKTRFHPYRVFGVFFAVFLGGWGGGLDAQHIYTNAISLYTRVKKGAHSWHIVLYNVIC